MNIIVKMVFGSKMYGTNTPESDTDYKGIFIPSKEQVYLGKIPKSVSMNSKKSSDIKNTSEDVDTELYSLQYFIQLACEGQTVALDMLHAPDNMILQWDTTWAGIVWQRKRFYTKNLDAFVGYARKQAAKYGIKGSRLSDTQNVQKFLLECIRLTGTQHHKDYTIGDFWDDLPEGEHISKELPDFGGMPCHYVVCGRKIQSTTKIDHALDMINRFVDAYGERARQAANNEGIDWKAISHAVRAALQVKEIFEDGTITFPLKEAELVRDIKQGKLHYRDVVSPYLENLIDKITIMSENSTLPKIVDRKYWDNYIIEIMRKEME